MEQIRTVFSQQGGGVALLVLLRVEEKNAHLSFQSPAAAATTQTICAAHKPAKQATDTNYNEYIQHHKEAWGYICLLGVHGRRYRD